jgi:hypothetical protein
MADTGPAGTDDGDEPAIRGCRSGTSTGRDGSLARTQQLEHAVKELQLAIKR